MPPRAVLRGKAERRDYLLGREWLERRSVLRGLILLAMLIAAFALFRGGAGRAFPRGWWLQW